MHSRKNQRQRKKTKTTNVLTSSLEFGHGIYNNEYFQSQVNKDVKFSEIEDNIKQIKNNKNKVKQKQKNNQSQNLYDNGKKSLKNRTDVRQNNILNFININLNTQTLNENQDNIFQDDSDYNQHQILQQDSNISRNFFLSNINNPSYDKKQKNQFQRLSINSTNCIPSKKSSTKRDKQSLYLYDKNSSQEISRYENSRNRDMSSFMLNDVSQDSMSENKTLEKKIRKPNLNSLQLIQKNNQQILIEFLSNYGSDQFIGLNEVKIYDTVHKEVLLVDQVFSIYDQNQQLNNIQVPNLNNGIVKTNNSKFMLCLDYKKNVSQYSLNITISDHNDCQFLVIWNYNENFQIGVKNCNIYYKNKKVFEGILNRGNEKKNDGSYFTIISLQNQNYDQLKLKLLQEYGLLTNSSVSTKKSQKLKQDSQKFEFIQIQTQQSKNVQQLKSVHDIQKINEEQYRKRNYSQDQQNTKIIDNEFSYFRMPEKKDKQSLSQSSKQEIISLKETSDELKKKIEKKFFLPQTPISKEIHLYILNTWGNKKSIQFNQLQIYNTDGEIIQPLSVVVQDSNNQIIKTDVQLLFRQDTKKIIKNKNYKIKLEEYQNIQFPIKIKIQFFNEEFLSMIRIINFYGSRADQNQSIKKLIIKSSQSKKILFMGYLSKIKNPLQIDQLQENTIIYTQDKKILNKILRNDVLYQKLRKRNSSNSQKQIKNLYKKLKTQRPITIQKVPKRSNYFQIGKFLKQKIQNGEQLQKLYINPFDMWNNTNFKGFYKIKFIDINQKELFYDQDYNVIFVDQKNRKKQTNKFDFSKSKFNIKQIQIIFRTQVKITKIQFYQILEYPVKTIQLLKEKKVDILKGQKIPLFFPTQKLNENCQHVDLPFDQENVKNAQSQNNYTGFTLEFQLISTHGDPYYIGLNGIQIFDEKGNNILTKMNKQNFFIKGYPQGVYSIKGMEKDQRKIDNLYQGQYVSKENEDIWLTPFIKNTNHQSNNSIYLQFKYPQQIGIINIWNYQKTPERGVKDIMIKLDGQVIFLGTLNDPNYSPLSSIILNQQMYKQQKSTIEISNIKVHNKKQVLFINEGICLQSIKENKFEQNQIRPSTGIVKKQEEFQIKNNY